MRQACVMGTSKLSYRQKFLQSYRKAVMFPNTTPHSPYKKFKSLISGG